MTNPLEPKALEIILDMDIDCVFDNYPKQFIRNAKREYLALTAQLKEAEELVEKLAGMIEMASCELGVPNDDYPAPITNAKEYLTEGINFWYSWKEKRK